MENERMCYACAPGEGVEPLSSRQLEGLLAESLIGIELSYDSDHLNVVEDEEPVLRGEGMGAYYHVLIPEEMDPNVYEERIRNTIEMQEEETYQNIRQNMTDEDIRAWAEVAGGSAIMGLGAIHSAMEGRLTDVEAFLGGGGLILKGWLWELHPRYGPNSIWDGIKTLVAEQRLPSSSAYETAQERAKERVYVEEADIDLAEIRREVGEDLSELQDLEPEEAELLESVLEGDIEGCRLVKVGLEPKELSAADANSVSLSSFLESISGEPAYGA